MSQTKRSRRQFFFLIGFGLIAFGVWKILRDKPTLAPYLMGAGASLLFIELFLQRLAAYLFFGWMYFANWFGRVNTILILGLFFLVVLTPVGLVTRLVSRNSPFSSAPYRKRKSSWMAVENPSPKPESYFSPF